MKSDKAILKIGFDAKRLFNNDTGLGNYSRTLLNNLIRFYPEHEYHLFTDKIELNAYKEHYLKEGCQVHVPNTTLKKWWRTYGVSNIINALDLDIFHGLSHEIPFGINHKTKTVVTFHDLIYEVNPQLFSWVDRNLYKVKYRSSAKRANHIVAVSNQTKEDLENIYQIPNNKISVIYQTLNSAFLSQPNKDSDQDYFLFVGSLIKRKGLQFIVEAYSLLPIEKRKKVVVIGNGSFKKYCQSLIDKNELSEYFIFIQSVDNIELYKYYDDCIALILPSMHEGFGIPIIESLLRKRPVITTADSAMAEAAGPGGIMVEVGNISQLANAISSIQDSDFNNSLGTKGYEYASSTFDPLKLTNQLMDLYFNIAQNRD